MRNKALATSFRTKSLPEKTATAVNSPIEPFPTLEDVSTELVNCTTFAGPPLPPLADKTPERGISNSPTIIVSCAPKNDVEQADDKPNGNGDEDEDREHMTLFKAWGLPAPRDRPRSRIRKVILTSLPPNTDLTLVQSLISGGAIENFTLNAVSKNSIRNFHIR